MSKGAVAGISFLFAFAVVAGILYWQRGTGQPGSPIKLSQSASLLEYDAEGKSAREIAEWIYDNHGCVECHTLTKTGLFGLTAQGEKMAVDFQGCPGMLTTVWETLTLAEEEWTPKQSLVRQEFVRFGCTVCHEVGPTGVGLTAIGAKASLLHMGCSQVDSILNQ
jgi:cytochrome c551/c552